MGWQGVCPHIYSAVCADCPGPNTSKHSREGFSAAEDLLTSAEEETQGILGDSLSCPGFQPSGLSASKMCTLGLLHPALLEVTLAVLVSWLNPSLR